MVDKDDYEYVLSGATDLVGCQLEGANFQKLDLRGKDFSRTNLKDADFSGSILTGCKFDNATLTFAKFVGADLTNAIFGGSVFKVDFSKCDLRNAVMKGLYNGCSFYGSNLISTNFSSAHFKDDCIFEGSIFDGKTNFDGVQLSRPASKNDVFRHYKFERGQLTRKNESAALGSDEVSAVTPALAAIDEGLRQLQIINVGADVGGSFGIGHNQPPTEFELSEEDKTSAQKAFEDAREALVAGKPDNKRLEAAIAIAAKLSSKALSWIGRHADTAVGEFSKAVGKSLGGKTAAVVGTAYFSGAMNSIVDILSKLIG